MHPWNNVFRLLDGRLIKNTEKTIKYTDENGILHTVSNPTFKDFKNLGLLRRRCAKMPEYNKETEYLVEKITAFDDYFLVEYEIKEVSL